MHRRSLHGLLVVRTMLIANGAILALLGVLYLVLGAKPGGWFVGGFLAAAAIGLWLAVPLTDPYRSDRHRTTW